MSLGKKIYFSPLGYLIALGQRMLAILSHPIIVYGYYNKVQKRYNKATRVSSSAIITEKDKLDIGDNVWVNHYARIDASGGVKIGDGCQIGYCSMILSHSSHMAIRLNGEKYIHKDIDERKGYIHKQVVIGEYTFIGGHACIMPGVKIGKGCVVGVGSVVTKDISDYSIVAGVPAKVIGSTIDTDKPYWDDEIVNECYYAQNLIKQN